MSLESSPYSPPPPPPLVRPVTRIYDWCLACEGSGDDLLGNFLCCPECEGTGIVKMIHSKNRRTT